MKTITITNLKGGVGKTTTAINLAHRLASEDKRVLLLDTDHQANLSRFFNAQSERNIYQLFIGKAAPQPYAISDNLHIISSDMETATINFRLIGQMAWHSVLRNKLVSSGFTALYDYCIIDCPPALDMIVTNALTAADYVLIPLTSGQFAYDGLRNIIDRIDEIKESANPHIEILGILLTMVSERTRAVKTVKDMLKEHGLDIKTCEARIRQCEAFKQAELKHPGRGCSLTRVMTELKDQLSLLGRKTEYKQDYAPEVLEAFDNKHLENDYWVRFNCPEFTSLCPITGQPDFAEIRISYIPEVKMVESKSLKLYLFSFRNHGAFHEDCVNIIMKDLIKLMNPKYIEVTGIFTPRGGISIYPYANYGRPGTKFEQMAEHRLMNRE